LGSSLFFFSSCFPSFSPPTKINSLRSPVFSFSFFAFFFPFETCGILFLILCLAQREWNFEIREQSILWFQALGAFESGDTMRILRVWTRDTTKGAFFCRIWNFRGGFERKISYDFKISSIPYSLHSFYWKFILTFF
jgi:hypothetical protein